MIVEYIRDAVGPGRADAFRQACAEAAGILQADPRCLSYEVAQGLEEPTHFVVRIEWDSLDGHLEGFRKDPAFGAFLPLVRPYFDDIEEMRHYEVQITSPDLPEKGLPSLYDWVGGHEAIAGLINAFYDRVEHDELLGPFFPGGDR